MRSVLISFAILAVGAMGQYEEEKNFAPIPYQFAYKTESTEGSNSHQETSDGNGRVQGSYSLTLADGRQRVVNYYADETGFHADVNTNELGTESKSPADVKYTSSAITGEEAAIQYGYLQQKPQAVNVPSVNSVPQTSVVNSYTRPAAVVRSAEQSDLRTVEVPNEYIYKQDPYSIPQTYVSGADYHHSINKS